MNEHEMRWEKTPKGLVKKTPWGWRAACKCGWEQQPPASSKKFGVKLYHAHKEKS